VEIRLNGPSDSDLLERARQGDSAAFPLLIRRYDRYLYRVARSVLQSGEEAEDVIQETFIRAYRGLGDFRGNATLRTWLTRITLNEALRRRKQQPSTVNLDALQKAQERGSHSADSRSLTAQDNDPERAAAQHEIRNMLEKAIDDLPAAFRTVFIMRDVEDLSIKDVAEVLGLRVETVKTRLHRARRMLRESLGEQLSSVLKDVFPFAGERCNGLIQRLLDQIGIAAAIGV
jgi:RNA polymerase sigma-70 factor (ECF subfamily)